MADEPTPEVTETETTEETPAPAKAEDVKPSTDQIDHLPADHPLVKAYEAQKATIKELKAKASRFDEMETEKQREAQSWQERAEAAEKDAAELRAAKQISDWKTEITGQKKYEGVSPEVLYGTSYEEIEAHAAKIKALLPDPRKAGQVPTEGRTVTTGTGDPATQFAEIIRSKTRQG